MLIVGSRSRADFTFFRGVTGTLSTRVFASGTGKLVFRSDVGSSRTVKICMASFGAYRFGRPANSVVKGIFSGGPKIFSAKYMTLNNTDPTTRKYENICI